MNEQDVVTLLTILDRIATALERIEQNTAPKKGSD